MNFRRRSRCTHGSSHCSAAEHHEGAVNLCKSCCAHAQFWQWAHRCSRYSQQNTTKVLYSIDADIMNCACSDLAVSLGSSHYPACTDHAMSIHRSGSKPAIRINWNKERNISNGWGSSNGIAQTQRIMACMQWHLSECVHAQWHFNKHAQENLKDFHCLYVQNDILVFLLFELIL